MTSIRRWSPWVAPSLVAALASVMGASPAMGYVRTKTLTDPPHAFAWPNKCITFELQGGTAPDARTRTRLVEAFRASVAAWTTGAAACADLEISPSALPAGGTGIARPDLLGHDGHNRVLFVVGEEWCEVIDDERICYDPNVLALTTVSAVVSNGRIVDADMQINAIDHTWGDLVAGDDAEEDLENTLTHELGHAIGFDHTCRADGERPMLRAQLENALERRISDEEFAAYDVAADGRTVPLCDGDADAAQRSATMTAQTASANTDLRSLTADDALGVCRVYSDSANRSCRTDSGGGCSADPRPRPRGDLTVLLTVVATAAGLWRGRRRNHHSGG